MNIVLIGMRGSGKSTIGKLLAEKLQKPYIEMDKIIEERAKMRVKDIVATHGWPKFRELERMITKELEKNDNAIIATGGGAVVNEENRTSLKKNGKLVWLTAPLEILVERIGEDANRASLTGASSVKDDMENVYKERESIYRNAADCIISTEGKEEISVVDEIISKFKNIL